MARVGWPHKNGVEKRQNSKLFCKFALKTIDMKDLLHIKHAGDYAAVLGTAVDHPLVNVIHYDELGAIGHNLLRLGVYAIFVQDNFPTDASYGLSRYITSTGSLTAAAPGQIIGKSDDGHRVERHGWALLFDPEMMRGTAFERNLVDYHFFSYNVNEALRTTDDEKLTLWRLMEMIRTELARQPRTAMADTIVGGLHRAAVRLLPPVLPAPVQSRRQGAERCAEPLPAGARHLLRPAAPAHPRRAERENAARRNCACRPVASAT